MKLDVRPAENSFYESFSDLIFGTLVLFLVMVMALALQLRNAQQKASRAESAAQLVYAERRSGSASQTSFAVALMLRDGKPFLAMVPESLQLRWEQPWSPAKAGADEPVLALCAYFLDNREGVFLDYDGFLKLSKGMTRAMSDGLIECGARIANACLLIDHVLRSEPNRAWSPSELAKAVGGIGLREYPPAGLSAGLDALAKENGQWRSEVLRRTGGDFVVDAIAFDLNQQVPKDAQPPRLRFQVDGDRVRVGEVNLTFAGMRALLRTIRPGKGFYIEHLGPAEEIETPPPDQFLREVLQPTGFVNRVLSDVGLREIQRRGR